MCRWPLQSDKSICCGTEVQRRIWIAWAVEQSIRTSRRGLKVCLLPKRKNAIPSEVFQAYVQDSELVLDPVDASLLDCQERSVAQHRLRLSVLSARDRPFN